MAGKGDPDFGKKYPPHKFTKEESAKGGIKSGQTRAQKRTMKETLEHILSMSIEIGEIDDIELIQSIKDTKGKNITVKDVLLLAQVAKAQKGDTRAFEVVRDTIGENPTQKAEITANTPTIVFDMPTMWTQSESPAEAKETPRKRKSPPKGKTASKKKPVSKGKVKQPSEEPSGDSAPKVEGEKPSE